MRPSLARLTGLAGLAAGTASFVVLARSALLVLTDTGESTGPTFETATREGFFGLALLVIALAVSIPAAVRRRRLSTPAVVVSVAALPVVILGYFVALAFYSP